MSYIHNTASTNITDIQPKRTVKPLKSTAPASSTEKPLKALKSSSGLKIEMASSLTFHSRGIPLLVSPSLLRLRNLGQIDLARLIRDGEGWVVEMAEVKSSKMGVEMMERAQVRRLSSSQQFLAALFGHRTKLFSMIGR